MNKKIAGGVSALGIGVIGTGVYLAEPAMAGSATNTATDAAAVKQHAGHPMRRLRRAGVHGQATVRTRKGFADLNWQRGTLTSATPGTLTVRSLDGTTWQWRTDGTTRVRKNGQRTQLAKLTTGDFVVVAGRAQGGARTARIVVVPKHVPAKATQAPAHN